jgi:dihydroorotate dehydrogenase (NAD+) catalytic subunit
MVKTAGGTDPLLRRPFSVFEILRGDDGTPSAITILSKRIGPSTRLLYDARPGQRVACLGPLGRPFTVVDPPVEAWMVAGGVGLAPFATLAEALRGRGVKTMLYYGARTGSELFYLDFFRGLGVDLVLTTEDGTTGEQGRVVAPLDRALASRPASAPLMLYACGPERMLAATAHAAATHGRPCQVSVERIMGCGLGGCYSCVVPMRGDDGAFHHVRSCMDLSVRIGALTLKNPVIAASGCFGYGVEYADVVDLASLGGIVVKGLFLTEREGHAAPRIVETPSGMLNAIGLQGIGVRRFVDEKLPELRARGATVIVNVCGTTLDEYVEVSRILSDAEGVAALELNISCPNIKEGGIQFGCSLAGTHDVVSAVRKVTHLPVIPKLTPNVTDVASFARAAEDAGADAVSLVNTFLAMVIDVETRRPKISNVVGGLSGPAIRPIAVRMVYECRQTVRIPVIGMGGIGDARDALEFMIAGATAVQVGTANFVDPFIWPKLLDGIRDYLRRHGVPRVADLVGSIDTADRQCTSS